MNNNSKLLKRLPNPLFSFSQARELGLTRHQIKNLLASGELEKYSRGIYHSSSSHLTDEDQYRAAVLQVGSPSAVCLLSALSHYNLTDLIPRETWLLVPAQKHSAPSSIRLVRCRDPKWNFGIEKLDGYWITSIERTLVECMTARRSISSQTGIEALRRALKKKDTTLGKVTDLAKALGHLSRIQAYIEALA